MGIILKARKVLKRKSIITTIPFICDSISNILQYLIGNMISFFIELNGDADKGNRIMVYHKAVDGEFSRVVQHLFE